MKGEVSRDGPVVIDLRPLQSPRTRGRGPARFASELARAFERHRPDLVCRYLLAPELPPPGDISDLLATGLVAFRGAADWLPGCARVYHSLGPTDLSVRASTIWPAEVEKAGMSFTASLYDWAASPHGTDSGGQEAAGNWRARGELLRQADALLTVTEEARNRLVTELGLAPAKVTAVGCARPRYLAAPRRRILPYTLDEASTPDEEDPPGGDASYVFCLGNDDEVKDLEFAFEAFGLLPRDLRLASRLVVAGELGARARSRLESFAAVMGISERLVFPGFVTDSRLAALYSSAAATCFPASGGRFSIAILEALACGAAVIAADASPFDRYVRPEARFAPSDPASMSRLLARVMTTEARVGAGRLEPYADTTSWESVVEISGKVFEQLASRRRRAWRRHARVAFISPFPPIPSGVAAYSDRLVPALRQELDARVPGAHLDCFADGLDRLANPEGTDGGAEWRDARVLPAVEGATGGYDRVVCVLGNSEYHASALATLRRRGGIAMAHEVRLTNLVRFSARVKDAAPGGLEAAIARAYPCLPAGLGRDDVISAGDIERFGLLMMRDVARIADQVLVSNGAALRLAALDVGPDLRERISVLPFALALPEAEIEAIARAREAPSYPPGADGTVERTLVSAFGIVDPSKSPGVLLEAFARLADEFDLGLAMVGPVSTELREELTELALTLGVAERFVVTGAVPRAEYLAWLGRTTLAVQLRAGFGGEASAAVGDCLAAGLPTLVSDIGWMGELPHSCVRKVATPASAEEVSEALERLLRRPAGRAELASRAEAFAAGQTYERVASELVSLLALSGS